MNELERQIRREIETRGPMPFDRFMDLALYHPDLGYYTRGGRRDYYTNAHLQPVFGRLIAQKIVEWRETLGRPSDFTVVELGSGAGQTARAVRACLPDVPYIEVERSSGALPDRMVGVVFSNEFFDALPVRVLRKTQAGIEPRQVAVIQDRLSWADGEGSPAVVEVNQQALDWMARIAGSLERGFVLTIDYGYTAEELARGRFPQGSLMSYRGHTASEDVLAEPGERDITAHVNFTALIQHGEALGLRAARLQTQAQFLLSIGERDQFHSALAAADEHETRHLRLQLKHLLYGLGETFRVLIQQRR